MTDPASLAFGVLGTIGVVLDASITTYTFVSSIKGAPRSLESLASHVFTLESVLSALKELTSQPHVRQRSQRPEALKCLQSALSGCNQVLNELNTELRSYVRHQPASGYSVWQKPPWSKRLKYGFKKGQLVELEARLLGRMDALHLALGTLNLAIDQQAIAELALVTETAQSLLQGSHVRSFSSQAMQQMLAVAQSAMQHPQSSEHFWLHSKHALSFPDTPSQIHTPSNPFGLQLEISGSASRLLALVDSSCTSNYITAAALHNLPTAPLRKLGSSSAIDANLRALRITGLTRLTFTVESLHNQAFTSDFIVIDDRATASPLPCDCLLGRAWLTDTDAFKRTPARKPAGFAAFFVDAFFGTLLLLALFDQILLVLRGTPVFGVGMYLLLSTVVSVPVAGVRVVDTGIKREMSLAVVAAVTVCIFVFVWQSSERR